MTEEEAEVRAEYMRQGNAVARYLKELRENPQGVTLKTEKAYKKLIATADATLDDEGATDLQKLDAVQRKMEAEKMLGILAAGEQEATYTGFLQYAKAYATRKGISHEAFRMLGVPKKALDDAGIYRAS